MKRQYAPQLPAALEVHPTEEEFAEPMRYIQFLHQRYGKEHGIVKVVPPKNWAPKLGISFDEFTFTTCEQQIDQLNHRDGANAKFIRKLRCFFQDKGREFGSLSVLSGLNTDLYQLYKKVQEMGGYESVCKQNMWGLVSNHLGYDSSHETAMITKDIYKSVLLDFDRAIASGKRMGDTIDQTFVRARKRQNASSKMGGGTSAAVNDQSGNVDKGAFGFEEGSEYTMTEFKRKVDQFNKVVCLRKGLESLAEVEEYYWRVVTTGEENLTVEYGNDLDVGTYSSAFPKPEEDFGRHPWNLNQLPRESGSLLRNMTFDVNGVSRPWLYVGMAFSSFCWHNEDNYLYSINYMHAGNTKVWYGVPGIAASQFEHVFAEKVPELFNSDRNLLYRLTTMINPSTFVAAGVRVTRALHTPGTFIVTFPQAYHAGFSIGWNVAEAVNFATIDWLKWGRQSELVYMSARRQSVVSVDHLSMCAIAQLIVTGEAGEAVEQPGLKRDLSFMYSREAHLRQHVSSKGIKLSCDLLAKKITSKQFPAQSKTIDEFAFRANSFHGNDHSLPMCCICRQWMFTSFVMCSGSCGLQKQLFYCPAHFDKACCSCAMDSRILVYRIPLSLLYSLNVIVAGERDARVLPTCGGDELFQRIKELPKGVSKFVKFAPDSSLKSSSGPNTPQSARDEAGDDPGSSSGVRDDDAGGGVRDGGGVHLQALNRAQGTADQPFVIDDDDDDDADADDNDDDAVDLQKPAELLRSPSKAAA